LNEKTNTGKNNQKNNTAQSHQIQGINFVTFGSAERTSTQQII